MQNSHNSRDLFSSDKCKTIYNSPHVFGYSIRHFGGLTYTMNVLLLLSMHVKKSQWPLLLYYFSKEWEITFSMHWRDNHNIRMVLKIMFMLKFI